jgi:hypothetical protein
MDRLCSPLWAHARSGRAPLWGQARGLGLWATAAWRSTPRPLRRPLRRGELRRPRGSLQVLHDGAHSVGCHQVRQLPAPASTSDAGEHVQRIPSCAAARPNPVAPSAPSSLLPQARGSPLAASALPPLGGAMASGVSCPKYRSAGAPERGPAQYPMGGWYPKETRDNA